MINFGPLPSDTLIQECIGEVWAVARMYTWTILVTTKIAVFPPYSPWKWYSSADGQKLNIGGVGITAKIYQVCIIIWVMTTLGSDYMHQSGRLMHQYGENYI